MLGKPGEAELREIEALAIQLADSTLEVRGRVGAARSELMPRDTLIAFVHIPKTAGGTVTNMLRAACSRRSVKDAGNYIVGPERSARKLARRRGGWEEWQRDGGRVVAGHVPYWTFQRYMPGWTRYMTFLREPVDRVLSHYYNHLRQRRARPHLRTLKRKASRTASIDEAFEMGLPMVCNLMTRLLCGYRSPMGELPESALEDAKANIRDFALVGLQERFEESIVLLQRILGLETTPYVNRHVSVERPVVEDIGEQERRLILEHNRLDAELYEFAQGLFEETVKAADAGFAADVERLRVMSTESNEEAVRGARELLERELPLGASKPKAELFATAQKTGVSAAALKNVSRVGVRKGGRDGQKIWTRTE